MRQNIVIRPARQGVPVGWLEHGRTREVRAAGVSMRRAGRRLVDTSCRRLSNSNVATARKLNWFFIKLLVKVAYDKYTS